MLKVLVANMDRYEASTLENKTQNDFAEWFELPIEPTELGKKVCETIGQSSVNGYAILGVTIEYEKIADELTYDSDAVLYEINEDAIALDELNLDEDREAIIATLMCEKGYDVREAVERVDDYHIYWDCEDDEELGKAVARDECISYDYEIEEYIDWSQFVGDRFYDYEYHDGYCIVRN